MSLRLADFIFIASLATALIIALVETVTAIVR
jgi:hypothetical protein